MTELAAGRHLALSAVYSTATWCSWYGYPSHHYGKRSAEADAHYGGYGYGGSYQGGYGQPMGGGFGDMRGGMRGRGFGPMNPMMMRGGPRGGINVGSGFNPGMVRSVKFTCC